MTRYLKGGHPKLCLEERIRQVNARRRNIGLQPDDKVGIDVEAPKCSNEEPKAPDCKKCRRSSPATAEKPPLPKGYGYLPLASGVDMDGNYWEILSDRTAFMSCSRCGKGDHRVANCPSLNKDKSESVVATAVKPLLPKGYCYLPLALGVDENGNYWEKLSDRTAFMVCTLCGRRVTTGLKNARTRTRINVLHCRNQNPLLPPPITNIRRKNSDVNFGLVWYCC